MTDVTEEVKLIRCCNCGIVFGALDGWKKLREGDGRHFFCPNGHEQWYTPKDDEKEAEAKKRQAAREEKVKQLIDIVFLWFSTVEDPKKHEKAATPDEILKRIIEIRELK